MPKRISSDKKVKENNVEKKEVSWFSKNEFRQFKTFGILRALCLHSTKSLIAVYSETYYGIHLIQAFVKLYNLDGDLVTSCEISHPSLTPISIYLSDNMMLTTETNHVITRRNGFNIKNISFMNSYCFDCDKDDNIYICNDSGSFLGLENTRIDIYSQDLEKIGAFIIQSCCPIIAIRIQEDNIVVLCSEFQLNRSILLRYSLYTKELLQTVKFNSYFFQNANRFFLCFDPLSNLLICSYTNRRLAVWYLNGRVQYYKYPGAVKLNYRHQLVGLAMTNEFRVIQSTYHGLIRIYEPK